jgi:hypothetical protein
MDTADEVRLVLLAIRLRGGATPETLASALLRMEVVVEDLGILLGRLELAGLVDRGSGDSTRWRLTGDGRREGERLLAVELDEQGARAGVTAAYTAFVTLNGPMLRVCTDWQLRDANPAALVVNDHLDVAFDRAVMDRFEGVQRGVVPICRDLAASVGRFRSYEGRLTRAYERVRAGDGAALDGPTSDTYHGTWFELHEDLIATLGRDRSTEPLPDVG